MSGKNGVEEISDNGKEYYISYVPIQLKGESDSWSVLTLQEKSSATAVLNQVIMILVFITIIFIMTAVVVIIILARKLTETNYIIKSVSRYLLLKVIFQYRQMRVVKMNWVRFLKVLI